APSTRYGSSWGPDSARLSPSANSFACASHLWSSPLSASTVSARIVFHHHGGKGRIALLQFFYRRACVVEPLVLPHLEFGFEPLDGQIETQYMRHSPFHAARPQFAHAPAILPFAFKHFHQLQEMAGGGVLVERRWTAVAMDD